MFRLDFSNLELFALSVAVYVLIVVVQGLLFFWTAKMPWTPAMKYWCWGLSTFLALILAFSFTQVSKAIPFHLYVMGISIASWRGFCYLQKQVKLG